MHYAAISLCRGLVKAQLITETSNENNYKLAYFKNLTSSVMLQSWYSNSDKAVSNTTWNKCHGSTLTCGNESGAHVQTAVREQSPS